MKTVLAFFLLPIALACHYADPHKASVKAVSAQHVGGRCEGCEAIYESPIPFEDLDAKDTLPDFAEAGSKLIVSGTVFQKDGRTPAPGVIIYAYHTDQKGLYSRKGGEEGWGKHHGYIRGWVKTDEQGRYRFFTLRPAPYPDGQIPAHIHLTLKEPGLNEYYIDDIQFEDDPILTASVRGKQPNRGGSGIVQPVLRNGIAFAERPVYLGKNIELYPR